ncbi:polyprenyl synthetase family protein [Amphibacillus marinus]|nr:farnesyl diphosphate synthase [Amphibacillus marinus]
MSSLLKDYISKQQANLNVALTTYLEHATIPITLKKSMLYSIQAGGKRIRPILMMASCEAFGGQAEAVMPLAIALEMVHTYSLIHDDLPAMDDDEFRRGQPTNHIKFGEATAILAGDALLTLSFQVISEAEQLTADQKTYAIARLSQTAGATGMVGGQSLDLLAEGQEISLEQLEEIHHLKTGQLLIYAMEMGAFIAGASSANIEVIKKCARASGLVFQIQDDILDINGDQAKIGKDLGSDIERDKSTYPKLLGLNGAIEQKNHYVQLAKQALLTAKINQTVLAQLIDYLSNRDN